MKKEYAFLGILLVAIVAFLFLILFPTLWPAQRVDASDGCGSSFSRPNSVKNGCGLVIRQDGEAAVIHYEVDLQAGSMEWTLLDPSGKTVWQSSAQGQVEDTFRLDPAVKGRYDLQIATQGAQGSYMFSLQ